MIKLTLNDTPTETRVSDLDVQTFIVDKFGNSNVNSKPLRQLFNAIHAKKANDNNKGLEKNDPSRITAYDVWKATCGKGKAEHALSSYDLETLARQAIRAKTGETPKYVSPEEAMETYLRFVSFFASRPEASAKGVSADKLREEIEAKFSDDEESESIEQTELEMVLEETIAKA